jgi:hypothetical protein
MPLITPTAPSQSIEALRAAFPSILRGPLLANIAPRVAAALTAPSAVSSLSPTQSYRVYTLGLSDLALAAKTGFSAATLTAWRHTLAFNGEFVTVDISVDPKGTNHRFASLAVETWAPNLQTVIDTFRKDSATANASYEVSLLQIPALGIRAVWLRIPSEPDEDLLVPVGPVRSDLIAGHLYRPKEFTDALQKSAARLLANDDPRKGAA